MRVVMMQRAFVVAFGQKYTIGLRFRRSLSLAAVQGHEKGRATLRFFAGLHAGTSRRWRAARGLLGRQCCSLWINQSEQFLSAGVRRLTKRSGLPLSLLLFTLRLEL